MVDGAAGVSSWMLIAFSIFIKKVFKNLGELWIYGWCKEITLKNACSHFYTVPKNKKTLIKSEIFPKTIKNCYFFLLVFVQAVIFRVRNADRASVATSVDRIGSGNSKISKSTDSRKINSSANSSCRNNNFLHLCKFIES